MGIFLKNKILNASKWLFWVCFSAKAPLTTIYTVHLDIGFSLYCCFGPFRAPTLPGQLIGEISPTSAADLHVFHRVLNIGVAQMILNSHDIFFHCGQMCRARVSAMPHAA